MERQFAALTEEGPTLQLPKIGKNQAAKTLERSLAVLLKIFQTPSLLAGIDGNLCFPHCLGLLIFRYVMSGAQADPEEARGIKKKRNGSRPDDMPPFLPHGL